MDLYGFIMLARLRFQRGDSDGVDQTLSRMASLGTQHDSCAEALRQLFAVKSAQVRPQQQQNRAEAWAKRHAPDLSNSIIPLGIGPYHCDAEYFCNLTWAQVQTALGQPEAALSYIEPALKIACQKSLPFRIVELNVAMAMANHALGDHAAAIQAFETALDIAAPLGYACVFDEGPVLDRMLKEAAQRPRQPDYARRLLGSFNRMREIEKRMDGGGGRNKQELIDPLSEREVEVLHLIAEGLSNSQIAERLYISQGTVKRHITNLYGKLSVQSRTQAIGKARDIGLFA